MPIRAKRFHSEDPVAELTAMLANVGQDNLLLGGIDPGSTGALAFIDTASNKALLIDIPTTQREVMSQNKGKKGKSIRTSYDHDGICQIFAPLRESNRVHIVLERGQPRPLDTAKTAFAVGMGYGMWPLFLTAMRVAWFEYAPSVWKQKMGLAGEEKEYSRQQALRIYPQAHEYLRCKSDHDRAEALLLITYHWRRIYSQKDD